VQTTEARSEKAPHVHPISARTQLKGGFAPLLVADSDGLVNLRKKNLTIANLSGLGILDDRRNDRLYLPIGQYHLDLDLWEEVHGVLAATIHFGVPFLPAMATHLGNRHAIHANFPQGLFHWLEPRWLNDRFKLCHRISLSATIEMGPTLSALDIAGAGSSPKPQNNNLPRRAKRHPALELHVRRVRAGQQVRLPP